MIISPKRIVKSYDALTQLFGAIPMTWVMYKHRIRVGMDFEIGLGKFQKLGNEEDDGEQEGVEEKEKAMT